MDNLIYHPHTWGRIFRSLELQYTRLIQLNRLNDRRNFNFLYPPIRGCCICVDFTVKRFKRIVSEDPGEARVQNTPTRFPADCPLICEDVPAYSLILYRHINGLPVVVNDNSAMLVNNGQGDGDTRWKGWAWKLLLVKFVIVYIKSLIYNYFLGPSHVSSIRWKGESNYITGYRYANYSILKFIEEIQLISFF